MHSAASLAPTLAGSWCVLTVAEAGLELLLVAGDYAPAEQQRAALRSALTGGDQ